MDTLVYQYNSWHLCNFGAPQALRRGDTPETILKIYIQFGAFWCIR